MNNTTIIQECLNDFVAQNSLTIPIDDAFELYTLSLLNKKTNLTADDLRNSIVDGSKDGGIDAFQIIVDDQSIDSEEEIGEIKITETSNLRIVIGQIKNTQHFAESIVDKMFISMDTIWNLDASNQLLLEQFNPQLVEKIEIFRVLWKKAIVKSASINIQFYYACVSNKINESDTFKLKKEKIIEQAKSKVRTAIVSFDLFSAEELITIHSQKNELKLELKFKEQPSPIDYNGVNIGYIGVVKIPDYFDFITDETGNLREAIFEENVRHYQGEVDVNKKISESLLTDYGTDFWWMNNGITIIAQDVRPFAKTLQVDGVQIVNGLQTSYTIGKHYKKIDDDKRSVLVKIVKSNDKETIDKIISATNRQTPVNPALLRATDDTQRKLELFFEQNGYFYDRRKNYYKNQGKPLSKIFSIQSTAQAIHSIINFKPSEARAKPTTLIKTSESYDKIFNSRIDFRSFLSCCLVLRDAEMLLKNSDYEKVKRSTVRMFIYHAARIAVSLILHKSHPSISDISALKHELFDENIFNESVAFLESAIDEFTKASSTKNVTSISKSGPFEDLITKMLIAKFENEKAPNKRCS